MTRNTNIIEMNNKKLKLIKTITITVIVLSTFLHLFLKRFLRADAGLCPFKATLVFGG